MSVLVKSLALVLIYLAAAKIGLVFGTVSHSVTIFWPPGGIALAALLLGGIRYLPAVLAAAYLAAIMVDAPLIFALGSSLGNALETLTGYLLLKRCCRVQLALDRVRDLFLIILLGGMIPAVVSALFGSLTLLASGLITPDRLQAVMWRWWRADVLGIAFFTPLILVLVNKKTNFFKSHRAWESLALWAVAIAVGQSVFLGWHLNGVTPNQPLGLAWVFPLLTWAGLRAGRRHAGLIQLLFVSQALASAYLKVGYFADDFAKYGMANFWMFAMLLALAGMALAIMSTSQRRVMHQLALNAKVFAVSNDGIIIVDADNHVVDVNPAFTVLTGYTRDEVIGKNPRLLSSGKQSREFYEGMWRSLLELGNWHGELWNRRKDAATYLERLSIYTLTDAHGRVVNRIGIFSDITLSRAEQESVAHLAQHDYLTNLPNRVLFRDRFNQQLAQAKRYGKRFAVIYIDLDRFKPVNDTLGHQVGDQLLVAVADRMRSLVREIDTVSRLGGDEFAILISEIIGASDVHHLVEKLQASFRLPFVLDGHTITMTASIGIATYPEDGVDMETLLGKADAAMYRGKHDRST